ncbi:hypothetical protein ABPG72_002829 [Tetrahymena utriculariae]
MSSSRERKRSEQNYQLEQKQLSIKLKTILQSSRSKKDKKDKKDKKEKKDKKDKKEQKERRDSREKKSKKESKDLRDRKDSRDREEKKDKKDKKDKKKRDKSEDKKKRSSSNHQKKQLINSFSNKQALSIQQQNFFKRKRSLTKSSSRGRKRSQPQRGYQRQNQVIAQNIFNLFNRQNFGFAFDSPPKEVTQKEEPAQSQEVVNDFSNVINNPNFNPKFKELFMKLQNSKLPDLQNSKCDRKLYIGNIPPGLQPVKCQLMINSALKQLKVNQEPGDSCVSIWISPEGNYGFAEFRTPDEATKALDALVNVTLLGQQLKVGRPVHYTKSSSEVSSSGANSAATGFSASGRFDILSLLDPNAQKNEQEGAEGAQQAANLTLIPGLEAVPPVTNKNMISLKVQIPTRILVLHNMIADGELIIDEEFRQIEEDVKEECSKHGKVVKITIPRPSDQNDQVKGQGRIFVEYENTDAARDARRDLNGRLFNNRTVQVQYFSEQKYLEGDLDYRIR